MPKSLASCIIFRPLSITDFLTSLFIIVWIVINVITFVKRNLLMKKDSEITEAIGRQLKKFRKEYLKKSPARLAAEMMDDFPDDKIQRQTITNQENSPSWSYIIWLHKKTKKVLNLEWLIYGEEDDTIPMIK